VAVAELTRGDYLLLQVVKAVLQTPFKAPFSRSYATSNLFLSNLEGSATEALVLINVISSCLTSALIVYEVLVCTAFTTCCYLLSAYSSGSLINALAITL
jgi:hypothetical protein